MDSPRVSRFEPLAGEWAFWRDTMFDRDVYEPQFSYAPEGTRRALDAGCGHGILTFPLAERVGFAVGMDVAFSMVNLARKRLRGRAVANVGFLVGDVAAPPFRPGTFDFILSVAVFHHSDVERSLAAVRALLTAGGRIAVIDVITRSPRVDEVWACRVFRAFKWVPGHVRRGGWRAAWRILKFHLSADWLRRSSRPIQTRAQFRALYSRHFPGCTFDRARAWGEGMFWESPLPGESPASSEGPEGARVSAPVVGE